MLFLINFYKNITKHLTNVLYWVYYTLFTVNLKSLLLKSLNFLPIYLPSLKYSFYDSFFNNFLLWNYILDSHRMTKSKTNTSLNTKTNYLPSLHYSSLGFTKPHTHTNPVNINLLRVLYNFIYNKLFLQIQLITYKSFSFSWYYIHGFIFILFIDACLTDDEPLWEPIEWSLVQTWILFIFGFAWVAENLIVSRYGSYAGRDKRVWMSWYKTFWLIEGYYVINYGVAVILVMVPFYFELNYNLSFIYSWWDWFSKAFFYKFITLYTIVLLLSYWLQINTKWVNFKKILLVVTFINIILGYLIYTQFIFIFFGYFTDPIWYQKTRYVDYVQLSHEPAKWGWGSSKKDHFTYHGVKTVLWFKNDGPFATSFLFCQIFFFICLFSLFIYWVVLFRRIFSMNEVPITYTTYCISSLKQFFFFFLFFYILILLSFLSNYWRFPIEYFFTLEYKSWYYNLYLILYDYPKFLYSILML